MNFLVKLTLVCIGFTILCSFSTFKGRHVRFSRKIEKYNINNHHKKDSTLKVDIWYFETDTTYTACNFNRRGLKQGKEVIVTKKQDKTILNNYKNGKLHGKIVIYSSNYKIIRRYKNGQKHGLWLGYSIAKHQYRQKSATYYKNGKFIRGYYEH